MLPWLPSSSFSLNGPSRIGTFLRGPLSPLSEVHGVKSLVFQEHPHQYVLQVTRVTVQRHR